MASRIREGDSHAFSQVHSLYKDRLVFYARQFSMDWVDIEDVLSDVFLALWRGRDKIRSDDHIRNFLFKAVRHQAFKFVRDRQRRKQVLDEMVPYVQSLQEVTGEEVSTEMFSLIASAVRTLPEEYRRIYELAFEKEFSPSEIARILEKNPSTVRTQKQRALDLIRDWISNRKGTLTLLLLLLTNFFNFFEKFIDFLRR